MVGTMNDGRAHAGCLLREPMRLADLALPFDETVASTVDVLGRGRRFFPQGLPNHLQGPRKGKSGGRCARPSERLRGSGPSFGLPRAVLDAVIIDAVVPQICEILLTDDFVDRPGADHHIHPSVGRVIDAVEWMTQRMSNSRGS